MNQLYLPLLLPMPWNYVWVYVACVWSWIIPLTDYFNSFISKQRMLRNRLLKKEMTTCNIYRPIYLEPHAAGGDRTEKRTQTRKWRKTTKKISKPAEKHQCDFVPLSIIPKHCIQKGEHSVWSCLKKLPPTSGMLSMSVGTQRQQWLAHVQPKVLSGDLSILLFHCLLEDITTQTWRPKDEIDTGGV